MLYSVNTSPQSESRPAKLWGLANCMYRFSMYHCQVTHDE
ncbi:hypothetical protein VCHA43P272_90012 [Vibrio chagasii]|nr:hypothetical protein VCHA53O466_160093 [Vibrio chagasii]CAH7395091.1 hypothetical protein VCHA43P272_90012 [Vibrio chagasii]